jgi:Immunity protein 10
VASGSHDADWWAGKDLIAYFDHRRCVHMTVACHHVTRMEQFEVPAFSAPDLGRSGWGSPGVMSDLDDMGQRVRARSARKPVMVMRWSATCVAVDEDDDLDSLCVALAQDPNGAGRCLMFQAALTEVPDADFDEVYCLVTETHAVAYGGIRQLELRDGRLGVVLSGKAARELAFPSRRLEISLMVGSEEIASVRDGLARVFAVSVQGCRPWRLSLPGSAVPVRARSLWRWPPWGHGPRGRRVRYRIVGVRGALVDAVAETAGFAGENVPTGFVDGLSKELGVSVEDLVGQRFSYFVVPDRFGATYSKLRRERPVSKAS